MKKSKNYLVKSILTICTFILLLVNFSAQAEFQWLDVKLPEFGVDFQRRAMHFEKDFGEAVFPEYLPEYNVFGALMLNEYIGFEGGFSLASSSDGQTSCFYPGDNYLGVRLSYQGQYETHKTWSKIYGPYAEIKLTSPEFNFLNARFFGSFGTKYAYLNLVDVLVEYNLDPITPLTRTYKSKKALPKANIGIEFKWDWLKLRTTFGWEKTSIFKRIKPTENRKAPTQVSLKDSFIIGIGLSIVL